MNRSCIISSVIDADTSLETGCLDSLALIPEFDVEDEYQNRIQARRLDRRSKGAVCRHPDSWRIRWQRLDIDFAFPENPLSSEISDGIICSQAWRAKEFLSMSFYPANDLLAIMVKKPIYSSSLPLRSHEVLLYSLSSSNRPLLVGSMPCPSDATTLGSIDVVETSPTTTWKRSWTVTISFGKETRVCSIVTREAIAKGEPLFELEVLPRKPAIIDNMISEQRRKNRGLHGSTEPLFESRVEWELLKELHIWRVRKPSNGADHQTDQSSRGQLTLITSYVAKNVRSGGLAVLQVGDELSEGIPEDFGQGSCQPGAGNAYDYYFCRFLRRLSRSMIANPARFPCLENLKAYKDRVCLVGRTIVISLIGIVSPPKDGCIFRNIAADSFTTTNSVSRLSVLWEIPDQVRPELYTYEIDGQNVATSLGGLRQSSSLSIVSKFYGKRIISLEPTMGGVHGSSPILDTSIQCSQTDQYKVQLRLGGLQMIGNGTNRHSLLNREVQSSCLIWGLSSSGITLSIFDLSHTNGDVADQYVRIADFQNLNPTTSHWVNEHCTCRLHDFGYHVILPSEDNGPVTDSAKGLEHKSSLTAKGVFSAPGFDPSPVPASKIHRSIGSVEQYDSLARKTALQRQDEAYRKQISNMKSAGATVNQVANQWQNSEWSAWGMIRKPDGW
ncbi:hypothetical protein MMC06_003056 [Schaereria dolodes]|nr:hypothetical protein [Schaereria dolodes]